jgi:acetate kinase
VSDAILTFNAGSSSVKFSLFDISDQGSLQLASKGQIEGIGTAPHLIARNPAGAVLTERRWSDGAARSHEDFLGDLLGWIEDHLGGDRLVAAGHRVVHGGPDFTVPLRVDDHVLAVLDRLCPLAPLHQPHNLAAIRAVTAVRPKLPQVVCFDTAFHHTLDAVATRVALTRELAEAGVRRYGFHGLSYEYVIGRLRELAPTLATGRVIMAHLGNGASLCGTKDGGSVDTTMGFTALDGLVMGTRCGDLDPGVILYLEQERGMDARAVEDLLYHRSGLLGVSGISSDMRVLLASSDPRAREAIDLFVFRIGREVGALASSLGGLDGLIFTAGIGENAAEIRAAVCARLAWLGVELDDAANRSCPGLISTVESRTEVWVVPTDEEAMIARHTQALVVPAEPRACSVGRAAE